jgi:hypothetical protein
MGARAEGEGRVGGESGAQELRYQYVDDGWGTLFRRLAGEGEEVILGATPKAQWDQEPHFIQGRFTIMKATEAVEGTGAVVETRQHVLLIRNDKGEMALRPHDPQGFGNRITITDIPEIDPEVVVEVIDATEFMRSGLRQQGRKRYQTRVVAAGEENKSIWLLGTDERVVALGGDLAWVIGDKSVGKRWLSRGAMPGRLRKADDGTVYFEPGVEVVEVEDAEWERLPDW